jgi:hypothetical protein
MEPGQSNVAAPFKTQEHVGMSKLASGVAGTNREDLEALVSAGDTSVPGVEASDLNDGDILARTREEVKPDGQMRFVYATDDGTEPITSDWIQQDKKREQVWNWIAGVKDMILQRGAAKMQAANAAAQELRAKKLREEQMEDNDLDSDIPDDSPEPSPAARAVGRTKPTPKPPVPQATVSADPTTYVEDQLELARERLRAAEEAQQDITREVLTARRDYDKWKTLAAALNPTRPVADGTSDLQTAAAHAARTAGSPLLRTRKG